MNQIDMRHLESIHQNSYIHLVHLVNHCCCCCKSNSCWYCWCVWCRSYDR